MSIFTAFKSFNSEEYDYAAAVISAVEDYCTENKEKVKKELTQLIAKHDYTNGITLFVDRLADEKSVTNPHGSYFNQTESKAYVLRNISDILDAERQRKRGDINFYVDCIIDEKWNTIDGLYRIYVFYENLEEIISFVKELFPENLFDQDELDKILYGDDE